VPGTSGRFVATIAYPEVQGGFAGVTSFPVGAAYSWSVSCTAGKKVLGGGCYNNNLNFRLYSSSPTDLLGNAIDGWTCLWVNAGAAAVPAAVLKFSVSSICATAP
jgi:hypothetical protein